MHPYDFSTDRIRWGAGIRPSAEDSLGIVSHVVVVIVIHTNFEDKPRQVVLSHCHCEAGDYKVRFPT